MAAAPEGSGFRVQVFSPVTHQHGMARVHGSSPGYRLQGTGFRVPGYRVQGSGFRDHGSPPPPVTHQHVAVSQRLEEEAVRDLRRGPDKGPAQEVNDCLGGAPRGGVQHPAALQLAPVGAVARLLTGGQGGGGGGGFQGVSSHQSVRWPGC